MKNSKWRGTFNWWEEYPPSEVKRVPKEELKDYVSDYNKWYSLLMETKWKRKDGKWVSEDGKWAFDRIKDAYECQRYYLEKIHDPTEK